MYILRGGDLLFLDMSFFRFKWDDLLYIMTLYIAIELNRGKNAAYVHK